MLIVKSRIGQILRTVAVLSAAAVLALPLATMPAAAQRTGPGVKARPGVAGNARPIVFAASNGNGNVGSRYDIYTVNADGSMLVDLTPNNTSGAMLDPAWSPNGSAIAYSAPGPLGGRYLYVMKNDGSQPTQITSGLYYTDAQPAWSPDGMTLAFISDRSGNRQLWTLSLSDGTLRQLTTDVLGPENPSWSPDGANIVFASAGNLYLIASEGSKPQAFVTSGKAHTPDWSPDGSAIAYVDGEAVWVRSVDGLISTLVGTFPNAGSPRWSLTGTQLTLSAHDGSGYAHIYFVDIAGQWVKQVTAGLNDDITPDW